MLRPMLEDVVAAHPQQLEGYRSGKTKLFGFFVGKAMAASGGKANPVLTRTLLEDILNAENS